MTGRMERVKAVLRTYGSALSNGRNDISTLKRHGWLDGEAHKRYWLISDPEHPRLGVVA